jgi:stearoyl-CoA desaturase (delta-9 desaturase)
MWKGAELYKAEARNQETLHRFGQGTPDDWIERNVYSSHSVLGIATMLVIDVVLFGPIGLTIWAVQMVWIPLFAAGVINGVGHYWGRRSFQTDDASRNIVPWGILIGGEELHNNHHAYPTSARFSSKWWELDIGWFYIRILELFGLAKVKKRLPRVSLAAETSPCDERILHAVIMTRYDILAKYSRSVKDTCLQELTKLKSRTVRHDRRVLKRWLDNEEHRLATRERERLHEVLCHSTTLSTLNSMRRELTGLWRRSSLTKNELIVLLEDWCQRAERSGIAALQEFSHRLRRYQIAAT